MILVSLKEDEETQIKIKGHAENQAVCHGVSGLFYALLGYLKESECVISSCRVEEGDAFISFKGGKEALKMFLIGLRLIEEAHGNDLVTAKEFAE